MCHINPFYPWNHDYELDYLRKRVADLEREAEKSRLRRKIEELERRRAGGLPAFPTPSPIYPRGAGEIIRKMNQSKEKIYTSK